MQLGELFDFLRLFCGGWDSVKAKEFGWSFFTWVLFGGSNI